MISFQGEIKAVQSLRVGRWILIVKPTRSKNSPILPSRSPLNIGKSLLLFTVLVCGVSSLSFDINSNNILADAQTVAPLAPTFPDNSTGGITIQITSPQDDQQVRPGKLSIHGISSDNEDTDCKVFADVNDNTPMQNVTATGDSGEKDDFSEWTFTYSQGYQLIQEGENELTAKITCLVRDVVNGVVDMKSNGTSMSKWFTVNVTGSSKEVTAAQ